MSDAPKAFVIMPFNKEFDSIYDELIREPLTLAGYEVTRADSLLNQQNILHDIVSGIASADLVVADLTATSPNVFYELGLSHAMDKPTVLIAQSMSDVPFDLRAYRVFIYDTQFKEIKKLKDFLKTIGAKHRRGELSFRNPVSDFSQHTLSLQHSNTRVSENPPATPGDKEWLDYLADGEDAMADMGATLQALVKDTESINEKISKHSAGMQALANNPTAGSARRFHKLSLLAASDINSFSNRVQSNVEALDLIIQTVDVNYAGVIQMVDIERGRQRLQEFDQALSSLVSNSRGAKNGIHLFRDAAIQLAERKLSKELSAAGRRLADTLAHVITRIEQVEGFAENAKANIQRRLDP